MARAIPKDEPTPEFLALVAEVRRDLDACRPETPDEMRTKWDALSDEITAHWPKGLTAEESIRRQRGPLP